MPPLRRCWPAKAYRTIKKLTAGVAQETGVDVRTVQRYNRLSKPEPGSAEESGRGAAFPSAPALNSLTWIKASDQSAAGSRKIRGRGFGGTGKGLAPKSREKGRPRPAQIRLRAVFSFFRANRYKERGGSPHCRGSCLLGGTSRMNIKVSLLNFHVCRPSEATGALRASADVQLTYTNGKKILTIRDVKIIEGQNGLFVSMSSVKRGETLCAYVRDRRAGAAARDPEANAGPIYARNRATERG